jgi:hypothetical protein
MRRRNRTLHILLAIALFILAATHQTAVGHMAQIATELVLAIVNGIAQGAAAHPGPAAIAIGLAWIAHQARTHRPHTAHPHP